MTEFLTALRTTVAIAVVLSAVVGFAVPAGHAPPAGEHLLLAPLSPPPRVAPPSLHLRIAAPTIPPGGGSILATIPVGVDPIALTYDGANQTVFVDEGGSGNLTVLNASANRAVDSADVIGAPTGSALDSSNGELFVASYSANLSARVTVFNASNYSEITSEIVPGDQPAGVAFDRLDGRIFVAMAATGSLTVLNATTSAVVQTVGLPADGNAGVVWDPANDYVYVGNSAGRSITVVNGTSLAIVGSVTVGGSPIGLAVDPMNADLYVANAASDSVSVVATASDTVVDTIRPTGVSFPTGVAVDDRNGYVYVTAPNSDNISVVNASGDSAVWTIPVAGGPGAIAYDNATGELYVADNASNTVTVLNGTFFYPIISALSATPVAFDLGESTTLHTNATGGPGPLSFAYAGLPAGCETVDAAEFSCTPTSTGIFPVAVYVNDTRGNSADSLVRVTVNRDPTVNISAVPDTIDANAPVTFVAAPDGGTAPITYTWTYPGGVRSQGLRTSHEFTTLGANNVTMFANDSTGYSVVRTLTVEVDPALLASLSVSNAMPLLGQVIDLSVAPAGGAPPYSYSYYDLPSGCVSENLSVVPCAPIEPGPYNVTVYVTDANGVTVPATVAFYVVLNFDLSAPSAVMEGSPFTVSVGTIVPPPAVSSAPDLALDAGDTYSYTGLPPGCASVDLPSVTCTTSQLGSYVIHVTEVDPTGNHMSRSITVDVVPLVFAGIVEIAILGGIAAIMAALAVTYVRRIRRRNPDAHRRATPRRSAARLQRPSDVPSPRSEVESDDPDRVAGPPREPR